ncbi:MAG: hypothetical protein EZS28_049343 [Streblomastix strix]|uniref:Uncharacterized protein n=1 Tax=Streblomastix strix TaxID=222440 RepID=A0A5J4TC75_9EUKA|nr:MAG: hypothetical protein EZS28_049343 [Streblomastix strix]
MTRRTNFTNKRPTSRDSYQTQNYANMVPLKRLQAVAQPHPTFVNAFLPPNIEINSLDPDQTVSTLEELPQKAITAAQTLLAGLSGRETSQTDFYAENRQKSKSLKLDNSQEQPQTW